MTSRSRFYVDTPPPREPKQRHSMFVTHSELVQTQDLSSNSSSATLPSAAGSVDRLTGLDEKKSSRFFTLKPKTSFSLRPFFRSTSSLASLSPSRRRKALLERRDSCVQTEECRPEFGEVGVQTLNASTVDVPVQTCLEAWEEGDSYGHRRLAYTSARASPFWCRPSVSSSGLSNSLLSKNVPKDPLASPKLVKYAVPGISDKTALHHQSTVTPVDVNSCQPASPPSHSASSTSTSVPVKYFSAKELSANAIPLSASTEYQAINKPQTVSPNESNQNLNATPINNPNISAKENETSKCGSETSIPKGYTSSDTQTSEVSNDLKFSISTCTENPFSALKTERTDSPSRRFKTVHFDLSKPESSQNLSENSTKPRNIEEDFEALLKDLNVLTDEGNNLALPLNNISREKSLTTNLISPPLKSALDILREDFLTPIPENLNECNENEQNTVDQLNASDQLNPSDDINKNNKSNNIKVETTNANLIPVVSKPLFTRSDSEYENLNEKGQNTEHKLNSSDDVNKDNKADAEAKTKNADSSLKPPRESRIPTDSEHEYQNTGEINKFESVAPTSSSIFTSANSVSNPETNSLEGNVYDNVIKEENSVKTVPLPILPSFFETSSHDRDSETREIVEYVNSNSVEIPSDNNHPPATMPFETEFDRNRLSRSSSRSSVQSNSKSGLDSFREPLSRFDSCENLDQLEEEIIRSLYSPDEGKLEDSIMKNIELPPSESFQNSGTTATHMRRVILDQLLNGKNVEDIVPNYSLYQRAHSVPESGSKHKTPAKYTAVLTKMCHVDNENTFANNSAENNLDYLSLNRSDSKPTDLSSQKVSSNASVIKHTSANNNNDCPKRASSVFLFPEDNISNINNVEKPILDISTSGQNKGSSILEVRRSSWTPQPISSNTGGGKSPCKEKTSDNKPGQCDFTNCLRPSKIQNSPFLAKINTRSMSPCNFSPVPPAYSSSPNSNVCTPKRNNSPPKPSETIGECDFASCLKPSQVQNSLFTAELSEITANKSTNSLRTGSPLTVRAYSPLPIRSSSLDIPSTTPVLVEEKSNPQDDSTESVKHKSELLITLQPTTKHSSTMDIKSDTSPREDTVENSGIKSSEVLQSDQNSNETFDSKGEQKVDSAVPPPPPPPPPTSTPKSVFCTNDVVNSSFESLIQDQKTNLAPTEAPVPRCSTPKTPVMIELEQKLQDKNDSQRRNSNDKNADECPTSVTENERKTNAGRSEIKLNGLSNNVSNGNQNGSLGILSSQREFSSSSPNDKNDRNSYGTTKLTFSPNTVITDEPPPPGAVLLDKKVTVDGDKVHTDKFYAIPVKEVLKEKTSTTKFIPAPPKYEGIGPTEEGIPIGLRNSVKKENMHNWYKTMFKSLHKADSANDSQEYIIGYTSEPETSKKDMTLRKKSSTLDSRMKHDVNSNFSKQNYPASVKSSIEVYNVRPRLIEDYEPGYSSVTDDTVTPSRRYLPSKNTVKPSYEFKNGYESDSNITKKSDQPEALSAEQQKMWYREIQKGGEIPQFGLGKPAPEKPKEPSIGPVPPPPLNYNGQPSCQQAVRPLTLPANYSNQNGNGYCQQMNGAYEMHMRHAIHSEMQQRRSPSSNQLSPPIRTTMKSPSRSPDMKVPAQALFDFKAESPKEIPLKKGDTVVVLRQLDKNWYEGEHKGVVGIFPISYVEIIPPEHVSAPVKVQTEGLGKALYDFVAQTSIELTVRKGDTITLLRRVDANWFEGIFNTKKGIIPISYIQVLQEPTDRSLGSPSQKSCTVSPSSLESREKLPKSSSVSQSTYSTSSVSPLPINLERRKLLSKKSSNLIEPVMYRALYSYSPQNSDELELQEGDTVYVVEMCDDGWFVGTSVRNGVFGIFPGNYVEKAC